MSARDTVPDDGDHDVATTTADRSFPVGRVLLGRAAVVVWNDVADASRLRFYDDDGLRATGARVADGAAVYVPEICRLAGPAGDAAPRATEH